MTYNSVEKRAYYAANREKILANRKARRKTLIENPKHKQKMAERRHMKYVNTIADDVRWKKYCLTVLKTRAKKRGIAMTLTTEDIDLPEICPVLGIKLFRGRGTNNHNAPSVDRFDNNKGYTKDNIRIISLRANNLKNNATLDEMEAVVAYMRGEK